MRQIGYRTEVVYVRVSRPLKAKMAEVATAYDVSLASLVEHIINKYMVENYQWEDDSATVQLP